MLFMVLRNDRYPPHNKYVQYALNLCFFLRSILSTKTQSKQQQQQQSLLTSFLNSLARTIKQIYDSISCFLIVADFFIVHL